MMKREMEDIKNNVNIICRDEKCNIWNENYIEWEYSRIYIGNKNISEIEGIVIGKI